MATPADAATNLLNSTPPITRFYAGVTFVISLSVHVLGLLDGRRLIWHRYFILNKMPPQLWRMFTSFFLTSRDLGILFDTYMLYNYGKELESQHFDTSGDFLFYLLFNGFLIILLSTFFFGGAAFCQAMGVAMAYSWSQRNRGRNVNFFFVTIKSQWMPYAIVAIAAIQQPGAALVLVSGIISAHAYEFLTVLWPRFGGGSVLLQTPRWLKWSFEGGPGTSTGGTGGNRSYGTAFDPNSRNAPPPPRSQGVFSGGTSTGRSPAQNATTAAWRNRGTGHRLGSD